jgi:hypothetical protein
MASREATFRIQMAVLIPGLYNLLYHPVIHLGGLDHTHNEETKEWLEALDLGWIVLDAAIVAGVIVHR